MFAAPINIVALFALSLPLSLPLSPHVALRRLYGSVADCIRAPARQREPTQLFWYPMNQCLPTASNSSFAGFSSFYYSDGSPQAVGDDDDQFYGWPEMQGGQVLSCAGG